MTVEGETEQRSRKVPAACDLPCCDVDVLLQSLVESLKQCAAVDRSSVVATKSPSLQGFSCAPPFLLRRFEARRSLLLALCRAIY